MYRDCQVTNEGDVYEIQADGSIRKIGSINKGSSHSDTTWLWFFFLVAVVVAIALGVKYTISQKEATRYESMYNDANRYSDMYYSMENEYNEVKYEYDNLKSSLRDFPMVISKVEIANVYYAGDIETAYGSTIYSRRSMYLKPRITYVGINPGNITLKVKLYNASGYLSTGTGYPNDCSYQSEIYVNSGTNTYDLMGWGGSSQGHWIAGNYRYEFWYGSKCLAVKYFTIY